MSKYSGYYNDLSGKAAELFEKAEHGDVKAQYNFAMYILCEPDGSYRKDLQPDDIERGFHYLKQAATQGVYGGGAALQIAEAYFRGELLEKDYKQARLWFNTALLKNNPVAACKLGDFAYYGYDCDVDYEKAAEYYIKAAPRFVDAFYRLGDMFLEGKFFRQDKAMAIKLYEHVLESEEELIRRYGFYSDAHDKALERLGRAQKNAMPDPVDLTDETEAQASARKVVLELLGEDSEDD